MESSTQVLVIGAGPVGLFAALCLRQNGVEVVVVDQDEPREVRSFAVVLHPRVVGALSDLGVTAPLLWQGQSFKRVDVYSEGERRAVLDLPPTSEFAEGGLTLPQNVLRAALETALRERGVEVHYLHQLTSLDQNDQRVLAQLTRREFTRAGVPAWNSEWRAVETLMLKADFVIGADGYDSSVRKALDIALIQHAPTETFAFFDVARDPRAGLDTELVLSDDFSSATYPLHGGMTRYSFQIASPLHRQPAAADLRELLLRRMPWRPSAVESVEWAALAEFRKALVERFGQGRVWLVGDAAHTTSPLGVQSLNVGLYEARYLARGIAECEKGASVDRLGITYEAQRQLEWRRLLGLAGPASFKASAPAWIRRHLQRFVASLPASGDELDELLAQLGLQVL